MNVFKEYHFHDGEFKSIEYTKDSLTLNPSQIYQKKTREYITNASLLITGITSIKVEYLYEIKKRKTESHKTKDVLELINHLKTYGNILAFDQRNKQYNLLVDVFYDYLIDIHFKAENITVIIEEKN